MPERLETRRRSGWARLWPAHKPPAGSAVRHGAWYAVVRRIPGAAVLDTRGKYLLVPDSIIEVRDQRPDTFTVVARPRDASNPAKGTDADLGHVYAVCPACGARNRIRGEPKSLRCSTCEHEGEIAWWETG